MKSNKLNIILLLFVGVLMLGIGCDYKAPTSLWDPDEAGTSQATITPLVANLAGKSSPNETPKTIEISLGRSA